MTNTKDPINYVVVRCGYVDRLLRYMDKIANNAFSAKPVMLYGKDITMWPNVEFDNALLATVPRSGAVIAEVESIGDALQFASELMEYNHCGMFAWYTLYEFDIVEAGGKRLCVLNFDTESG